MLLKDFLVEKEYSDFYYVKDMSEIAENMQVATVQKL